MVRPTDLLPGGTAVGGGIYGILCSVSGRIYIGQARNLIARWRGHRTDLRGNRHTNSHLQRAWNKYGEAAFTFHVLESCSIDDLNARESAWVTRFDRRWLYNLGGVGEVLPSSASTKGKISRSLLGRPKSETHRQNIAKARAGCAPPPEVMEKARAAAKAKLTGKARPRYVIDAMVAAKRGRPLSAEHLQKLSAAKRGRRLTDEQKQFISAALTGKPKSEEARANMRGHRRSPETQEKISRARQGWSPSPEMRRRISETLKGRPGRKDSPETKAKKSEAKRRYWAARKAAEGDHD